MTDNFIINCHRIIIIKEDILKPGMKHNNDKRLKETLMVILLIIDMRLLERSCLC